MCVANALWGCQSSVSDPRKTARLDEDHTVVFSCTEQCRKLAWLLISRPCLNFALIILNKFQNKMGWVLSMIFWILFSVCLSTTTLSVSSLQLRTETAFLISLFCFFVPQAPILFHLLIIKKSIVLTTRP